MTRSDVTRPAPCHRFENEALERLERGEALEEHFEVCTDCRDARRAYERLKAALAETAEDLEPATGWQDQVRARIAEKRRRDRKRRWRWGLGLAAAILAVVILRPPPSSEVVISPLKLETSLERGATVMRGETASPGDLLTLRAQLGGRPYAELRLYREEEELILRCSTDPPCVRRGDVLEATLPLDAFGVYQTLLLASDQPLPTSQEGFDADAGAALRAGAELVTAEEIEVQ